MTESNVKTLAESCITVLSRSIGRMAFSETTVERSEFLERLVCRLSKDYLFPIPTLYDRILRYYKLDHFVKSSLQRHVALQEFIERFMRIDASALFDLELLNLDSAQENTFFTIRQLAFEWLRRDTSIFGYAQFNILAELVNTDSNKRLLEKKQKKNNEKFERQIAETQKKVESELIAVYNYELEKDAYRRTLVPDSEVAYSLDMFLVPSRKRRKKVLLNK